MKQSHFMSFMAGIMVGTVLGILIGDEEKRSVKRAFRKQADWLRKEYEGPIKGGAARVKEFVKEHLA